MVNILTDPPAASRQIQVSPYWSALAGIIILLAVSFTGVMSSALVSASAGSYYISPGNYLIFDFIKALVITVVSGSIMDMVLQLTGREGNAPAIIAVLMIASLPQVFILPLVHIFTITSFSPGFFYYFISLLLQLWVLFAVVSAVAEMHKLEFAKSLLVCLSPLFLLLISGFFMLIILVIMGAEILSDMMLF